MVRRSGRYRIAEIGTILADLARFLGCSQNYSQNLSNVQVDRRSLNERYSLMKSAFLAQELTLLVVHRIWKKKIRVSACIVNVSHMSHSNRIQSHSHTGTLHVHRVQKDHNFPLMLSWWTVQQNGEVHTLNDTDGFQVREECMCPFMVAAHSVARGGVHFRYSSM